MAKLIYMYLSNSKECSSIDFIKFSDGFVGLLECDTKEKANNFIFKFLDVDHDGVLSLVSCIQMFKNLPKNSIIA